MASESRIANVDAVSILRHSVEDDPESGCTLLWAVPIAALR
jgi:hypothetical protein